MDKYTYPALQTIPDGGTVLLNPTRFCCGCGAVSQADTGVIRLSGVCGRQRTQYHVSFDANVAIPDGETVGPITLTILLDGAPLPASSAIVTPAAAGEFWHISIHDLVDVCFGDSVSIAIRNDSGVPIEMQNAILTV